MPLPLVVRTAADDLASRGSLLSDGWREIEILNVFEHDDLPAAVAKTAPNIMAYVAEGKSEYAQLASHAVCAGRQGRLWKDSRIDTTEALKSYTEWVTTYWMAPDTIRWLGSWCGQPAGFLMIRRQEPNYRIEWVAVLPEFRNRGIGRALLSAAMSNLDGRLRAGTQHDNTAATRLYLTSGFKIVERWRTWHK